MFKFVARSRVLNHAVTTCSRSIVMPAFSASSSSSVTSQFVNTTSFRLYTTGDEPHERHVPGLFDRLSMYRRLRRGLKRTYNPSNVQLVCPDKTREDDDGLYITIPLNRVKPEDLKVTVDHGAVFIQGTLKSTVKNVDDGREIDKYVCWVDVPDIDLQDKIFKIRDIKAEYNPYRALLKLTIPKLKEEDLLFDVNFKTNHDKNSCLD
ncbi:23.6 kDa heat shock protein, mitochondrial-like [Rutidosis leptorrhynchoides]|uniref:23.6 kDa heat shock protein, mitochondrial-like n=1 Tax=Rutidosis leptorrhynchoides TaxID=125765 RepID=UPI003A9A45A9